MGIVRIHFLLVVLGLAASGQQQSDVQLTDTGSVHRIVILDPGIALGRPTFLLPPSLGRDSLFIAPSFFLLGENSTIPAPFLGTVLEKRVDLLSPLRLQVEEESRLRSLQTVLGTVELAGVAYLAYRHIKKYGFLR